MHLNLEPSFIMEYLESNINAIRSQVKANRTYKEISNLFKQSFLEVRRGFSERNLRSFCSKHEIPGGGVLCKFLGGGVPLGL